MQCSENRIYEDTILDFTSRLAEFEKTIEPMAHPDNDDVFFELADIMQFGMEACRKIDQFLGGDRELRRVLQSRFREATAPWCRQSWIINRARTKPRGFTGDYQMLLAIYDAVPLSRGFGGYLDRWCLQMTLAKAICSRLEAAKSFLIDEFAQRKGTIDVLDVASGPGREFRGFWGDLAHCRINLACLDSDEGALEYVRRHVSKSAPAEMIFQFHQQNAMKMRTAQSVIEKFGRQDIIYSIGLADYLPDRVLIPMLRCWRESLKPGGCVYVAFKDKNYYDAIEYQWLMDWHFLERDEQDCLRLFQEAGYDTDALITRRDSTGVILNYISRQRALAHRRAKRERSTDFSLTNADYSENHTLPGSLQIE